MSTTARHSWTRTAALLATTAGLIGSAVLLPATTSTAGTTATTSTTLSPVAASSSTTYAPYNPYRGQYLWHGYAAQPAGAVAKDIYYRDQTYWGRLERTPGVYTFAPVDDLLKRAGDVRGKAGFRVMAYCPGCWMESRPEKDVWPAVTPSWMPRKAGTSVPDWDSSTFLTRWEALMKALGDKYRDDPRLGSIDVGGYGSYGEWHAPVGAQASEASMRRIVAAVATNFPGKHVLLNTMTTPEFTKWALDTYPNVGMRTDNLGCPNMYSMVPDSPMLHSYWETRPFVTEYCTRADMALAKDQVSTWHISGTSSANFPASSIDTPDELLAFQQANAAAGYKLRVQSVTFSADFGTASTATMSTTMVNEGSAPSYHPWAVSVVVTHTGTGAAYRLDTGISVRTMLPGSQTQSRTVGTVLPAGTYTARLEVRDQEGGDYLAPMALNNAGRTSDGAYPLGEVVVG